MKNVLFVLIFVRINVLFAQNNTFYIKDKHGKPIVNAVIYTNHKLATYSDENGEFILDKKNKKISIVYCEKFDIDLTKIKNNTIHLDCPNVLNSIEISTKYNPRNHLKNLILNAYKQFKKTDTVIYYKFLIDIELLNTNYKETFSGILKVDYGESHKKLKMLLPDIYLYKIIDFKTNIPDSIKLPYNRIGVYLFGGFWRHKKLTRRMTDKNKIVERIKSSNDEYKFSLLKKNKPERKSIISFYKNRNLPNYYEFFFHISNKNLFTKKYKNSHYRIFRAFHRTEFSKLHFFYVKNLEAINYFKIHTNTKLIGKYYLKLEEVKQAKVEIKNDQLPKFYSFYSNKQQINNIKNNFEGFY